MIQYRIPLAGIKISTNTIYAGIHWTKRKELKDSCFSIAKYFCRPIQKVESYPVEIRYRFLFVSRPLDTTNTTFMVKMFEDTLCALGILQDDSPQYVTRTIIEVVMVRKEKSKKRSSSMGAQKSKKDEDWVEITIKSINKIN